MSDGSIQTQVSLLPVHQAPVPPPGSPSAIWSLGLIILGGVIFHASSRLRRRITTDCQRKYSRHSTSSKPDCCSPSTHQESRVNFTTKKSIEQFKDNRLDAVMEKCKSIKSHLKKVQDPEIARKAKLSQLFAKSLPRGPLQITPDKLQVELRALRPVKQLQKPVEDDSHQANLEEPSSFLQGVRQKLRPVERKPLRDAENRIPRTPKAPVTTSSSGTMTPSLLDRVDYPMMV